MPHVVRCALALSAALAATSLMKPAEAAEVQHVVAKGHTIEAIAHRYHVTTKAILEANHLKDGRHLKVGDVLVIPGVQDKSAGASKGKIVKTPAKAEAKPPTYVGKSKTPGVVHATRLATKEDFAIHVNEKKGKQPVASEKTFEKMMRSSGGLAHPVEPRLMALVGVVSDHFGGRKIEVVSGFRPYTPTQHTAHSNHNVGRAIDFRVQGVPNEVVRDFCRTLHNVGCGYYPNSTFVHMDAREGNAFWIDYSKPGETPRYNAANVEADEGTSDVTEEAQASGDTPNTAPPGAAADTPANPAPTPGTAADDDVPSERGANAPAPKEPPTSSVQ